MLSFSQATGIIDIRIVAGFAFDDDAAV